MAEQNSNVRYQEVRNSLHTRWNVAAAKLAGSLR